MGESVQLEHGNVHRFTICQLHLRNSDPVEPSPPCDVDAQIMDAGGTYFCRTFTTKQARLSQKLAIDKHQTTIILSCAHRMEIGHCEPSLDGMYPSNYQAPKSSIYLHYHPQSSKCCKVKHLQTNIQIPVLGIILFGNFFQSRLLVLGYHMLIQVNNNICIVYIYTHICRVVLIIMIKLHMRIPVLKLTTLILLPSHPIFLRLLDP